MGIATAFDNLVKRDDRYEVDLPGVAFREDGSSIAITLRNMSYNGCMLVADMALAIGEIVRLAIPRMGERRAQVRWASDGGKAGARFVLEEIGPDEQRCKLSLSGI